MCVCDPPCGGIPVITYICVPSPLWRDGQLYNLCTIAAHAENAPEIKQEQSHLVT